MDGGEGAPQKCVRLLCRRRIDVAASSGEPALYWLVGSSLFLPPFTVASIVKCLYWEPSIGPESVHYSREADEIRTFLPRGLDVIGALFVGNQEKEENAKKAIEATIRVRELLFTDKEICDMVGASSDMITKDVSFFVSGGGKSETLEFIPNIISEDCPERFLWEKGCLLRCDLTLKLPIYVAIDKSSEAVEMFSSIVDAAAAKLRDPKTLYLLELKRMPPEETVLPVVLHGTELGLDTCVLSHKLPQYGATESDKNIEACSYFFSKSKRTSFSSIENADTIQVSLFSNQSENALVSGAPLAGYFPAPVSAKYSVVDFKLDVLCYSSRDFPLVSAVSKLIIPGLVDQLFKLKEIISPKLSTKHPQLYPYHFHPPGILHPITAIYDVTYGEMEMKQVEIRRTLHLRLGLPVDRPLLLIANSLNFTCTTSGRDSIRNGCTLLKDVHTNIPSSGVSGGLMSLIQGSYEYYHYLQNGFDDNGWGCAYRSLQTIISWFRLQYYTSIEVPSHREIQQALVEIGDKEPSFVGSREWIGAIELSFVLDKLLGVSCKIMNVRSGVELPEKCRELALHFETQGTPVMIGGGVLAYTLLGVDYNDVTGDCAFLILDPHYTGTDEIKRVVSGGWCGWKKAVDSRGKNFFLSDKFYNLLLPQRPNMV
ncbi:unnamed protein product [Spirodela intermedia]|uniref:Probable Ufm1-specific protease n=1 Tax=Spirodela intermedia TaxID=51605 RepID=A0A7I8KFC1_SPIIN|nr:unnamed protein product [Spirodela intermedia]